MAVAGFVNKFSAELELLAKVAIGVKALGLGKTFLGWGADAMLGAEKVQTAAGIISKAGSVAAAGWLGWNVGTYLREEFLAIEIGGIRMAQILTKAAAQYQAAWEMGKAVFNDDTIEAAQERLRVKLAQIDDEYEQLAISARQAKEAQTGQAAASDAAAQANTKVSSAVQTVIAKMQELAAGTKAAGQGAQLASAQLEQVFSQAIKGAESVAVVGQLRDKLQAAQAAGQLTADAAARLRVQLDQVGAAQGVKEMVTDFGSLKSGAKGTQAAIDKLVASFKFDDKASIAAFAGALQKLGNEGVLSAQQVDEAWQQALGKLNAQQLNDFSLAVKVAFAQGTLSAQEFSKVNEQILTASFDKLGVNAAQALGKISTGAQEAINAVDLVAESAKAAGVGVEASARAIEMAFMAAVPKADSLEAIASLEAKLKSMGKAGQISAEGLERMQAGRGVDCSDQWRGGRVDQGAGLAVRHGGRDRQSRQVHCQEHEGGGICDQGCGQGRQGDGGVDF